ncbi:MAG: hypothetical protein ACRETL_05305, partial [Gammaproteobacteria bacterium]
MNPHPPIFGLCACVLLAASAMLAAPRAAADVTQTTTMSFDMRLVKVNSTITERISGDKKRTDTNAHCDGFLLSMICGNMRGGEIVRLDKNLEWRLEPKKKSYVETPFPTPEQIAAVKAQTAAIMEKLKDCPQPASTGAPDTRKCQMSPPQFEVQKTDDTATIAGHTARRSWVAMKQTCNNSETGDACEFVVRIDTWLTQEHISGIDEQAAFGAAYGRKMG